MSKRRKIHVIYEHGSDLRPFGSAFIRLIRPLSHPLLCEKFDVTFGRSYDGQVVDAVIVDRLWRKDITLSLVERLVDAVRATGAKLIYSLDDNFLDLPPDLSNLLTEERSQVVRYLLSQADCVWVTTTPLEERFSEFTDNILVIPNSLDERLISPRFEIPGRELFPAKRLVIGIMGTYTHDDDLLLILPALRDICSSLSTQIEIQIIGTIRRDETGQLLEELPVKVIKPRLEEVEYPLFLLWFSSQVRWDIAVSPLQDTPFNHYKSDIKFLDYCSIGAAGIFSQLPAYQSTVRDKQTGLLINNNSQDWTNALKELILNEDLRREISQNAISYLYSDRLLVHCIQNWVNAIEYI